MSRKQGSIPTPAKEENPTVKKIKELFWNSRTELEDKGQITAARKIERQIAKLVAQVAVESPNTEAHGDALQFQYYMLLSLARMSKRAAVQKQLTALAYEKGTAAVAILLQLEKHSDLHAVFSASNLAIDLIIIEKKAQEGLDWMLKSSALLKKMAGKKKLPKTILYYKLYSQDYGIAQAYYDLGQPAKAKRILLHTMRLAPALDKANWSDLRGIAKAAELLGQIRLDELQAKDKTA